MSVIMPKTRTLRRAPRRAKRRKRRVVRYRPPMGPQMGGNFLVRLLTALRV